MKHNVFIRHKGYIHIYNQTPTFVRVHLMTYISDVSDVLEEGGGGGLGPKSLCTQSIAPINISFCKFHFFPL